MTWQEAVEYACTDKDASWAFFWCVSQAQRNAMDIALMDMGHPLACQAGTQEYRFRMLVKERKEQGK